MGGFVGAVNLLPVSANILPQKFYTDPGVLRLLSSFGITTEIREYMLVESILLLNESIVVILGRAEILTLFATPSA
jgi:hypothetical protein